MIVEGYAFKYDAETVLYETESGFQYREVIEKGALEGADLSDVPFKYNHNDGVFIVARTRNGSLELLPDNILVSYLNGIEFSNANCLIESKSQ